VRGNNFHKPLKPKGQIGPKRGQGREEEEVGQVRTQIRGRTQKRVMDSKNIRALVPGEHRYAPRMGMKRMMPIVEETANTKEEKCEGRG